ncbi:MAG: T9SS type A sorting domain-containing protein [Saprospiraceae bacterium]
MRDLQSVISTPKERLDALKLNLPETIRPYHGWQGPSVNNPDAMPFNGDPVLQETAFAGPESTVFPKLVIEGLSEASVGFGIPDVNGDIGHDHYIQIMNASWFRVFGKDGTPLSNPMSTNTLWSQFGTQSTGDPVVVYDFVARRWLIFDLASLHHLLFAVSTTTDPLGTWQVYSFTSPKWVDFPKFGIYPKAYLMTANQGPGAAPVFALNRQQLLDGDSTIAIQKLDLPAINGSFPVVTPMSWLGAEALPPTDEMFVARINDDAWGNGPVDDVLEIWTVNIDWENPLATHAALQSLSVSPFDTDGCGYGSNYVYGPCVPQPQGAYGLFGGMTIVANKPYYRNFGTHESAVLSFSVKAGTVNADRSGIRWAELRRSPGQNWAVYQESTFAPGGDEHRFLSGISISSEGDIGLAYAVSGSNTYPSLRYTGRRANDITGIMTIDEHEFATGKNVRSDGHFGHYFSMSLDPVDDSFWFTGEYIESDGTCATKIVQFSLRTDTLDLAATNLLWPQNSPDLTISESVVFQVKNTGKLPATSIELGYIFENGQPVIEQANLPNPLLPDSTFTHTFSQKVNMASVGTYSFRVFATFPGDQRLLNNNLDVLVRKLPRLDAGITDISEKDLYVCADTMTVSAKLTNLGVETFSSAVLKYSLNNAPVQTQNWSGNLAPEESVHVPIHLVGFQSGTNTISIQSTQPDGTADELPANDRFVHTFPAQIDGPNITLVLTLDNHPNETSWQLEDTKAKILYSRLPYPLQQAKKTLKETWCLEPGKCYTFTIFDAFGDGLDPVSGPKGKYSIQDVNGKVLASILQTNFGFKETNVFCLDSLCVLAAEANVTQLSSPTSSDGSILVSVTSGVSPFSYSIDGGNSFQSGNLFNALPGGAYSVVVHDANGCVFGKNVVVSYAVSVDDPAKTTRISVAPNPSAEGVFFVRCEGLPSTSPVLEYQVLDATGRPVQYGRLSRVDGQYAGTIFMSAAPAGLYLLRFPSMSGVDLVKIVLKQ